ncbi:MAG: hypothetical protein ACREGH_02665 [Minisyncoccia bacterium]
MKRKEDGTEPCNDWCKIIVYLFAVFGFVIALGWFTGTFEIISR